MPKISIIIPVYNTEKYLRECLDSVVNQTLRDIEIICINDGSTDNSLKILEEYALKDSRIKVHTRGNKGAAKTRNEGIEIAKAEFISFIDADDYLEFNTFYEKLYNIAISKKADIVKGCYKYGKDGWINKNINQKIIEDKNNFIIEFAAAIYNTKFIKENNITFPIISDMEDPVFSFNCAILANKIEIAEDANYIVVLNPNSVSRRKISYKQMKDKIIGLEKLICLANSSNIRINSFAYVLNFWFASTYECIQKSNNFYIKFRCIGKLKRIYNKFIGFTKFSEYTREHNCNSFYMNLFKNYIQKIFSVKNSPNKTHKVMTILGIKFKFKINKNIKIEKNYKKIIKKLEKKVKKHKIRVCFLVSETAKWNAQSLYDKMKNSDIFEPFVVVTNLKNTLCRPPYSYLLNYFKTRVDNVQIGWDEKTKQGIDLKKFNPDIVFYQQPWDLYNKQNVEYVSNFALTYYFSYAMGDAISCFSSFAEKFCVKLKRYFVFSKYEEQQYCEKLNYKIKNIYVIGHPKLDIYKNYSEDNYERKYVIYAPHHSFEENSLHYATFQWNGEYILNWAKKHPNLNWVFKPHPRFKYALINNKIMTEDEVEQYYNEWKNIGTCYYDGSYFDLFKNSKCLITDCGSFLIEYLPTKQPVIHLRNPKGVDYIPSNKIVMQAYYDIWDTDGLEKAMEELLVKNKDTKKEERVEVLKQLNISSYDSTEKIIDILKKDIGIINDR